MGRSLKLAILLGCGCASFAAVAWAQAATAPAGSGGGDPLNALWSLLGTSPVAVVSYLWAKSEQSEKRDVIVRMLSMVESDADHKATLRERLKGQDELIQKVYDAIQRLERKADGRP
jgi:hypothetical protein